MYFVAELCPSLTLFFREVWGQLSHTSRLQLLFQFFSVCWRIWCWLCQTQSEARYVSLLLFMHKCLYCWFGWLNDWLVVKHSTHNIKYFCITLNTLLLLLPLLIHQSTRLSYMEAVQVRKARCSQAVSPHYLFILISLEWHKKKKFKSVRFLQ